MKHPLRPWVFPFLVIVLTFFAFLPALHNQFVNWDDYENFVLNPFYRGLRWTNLQWMFTTTQGHYIPLTWMSLGVDYVLWGMNPFGYHLTSLALHLANACLFYFISLHLLRAAFSRTTDLKLPILPLSATLAALLFSIHPMRVESVVWISERRDVLAGFFLFLSVLSYFRASRYSPDSSSYRWCLGCALGLYVLSLLSKASGVTLAPVLLLIDLYPLRRLGGPAGWWGPKRRHVWLEKIFFFILALPAAWMAHRSEVTFNGLVGQEQYSISQRLAIAFYGAVFYLRKTILPLALRPLYALPSTFHLSDPIFLGCAGAVVVMTVTFLIGYRLWPAGATAYGTYVFLFAPTSGFILVGPVLAADHFSYFSCLGWAVLAGSAPIWAWEKWRNRPRVHMIFSAMTLSLSSLLLLLGMLSWKQTRIWHDSEALWAYTLTLEPDSAIAQNQMGRVFQDAQQTDLAIDHFKKAIEIIPDYALAHNNLGVALLTKGERKEAIDQFRAALEADSRQVQAHINLGLLCEGAGKWPEAVDQFKQAIEINPNLFSAQTGLAQALVHLGQVGEGLPHFQQALRIEPDDGPTQNAYGLALSQLGRLEEASEHFGLALKSDPQNAAARNNLAIIFLNEGKTNEAVQQFQELLKINPRDSTAKRNLQLTLAKRSSPSPQVQAAVWYEEGVSWLRQKNPDQARSYFERALKLSPYHALAHNQIGLLDLAQGQWESSIGHFDCAAHAKPPLADAENNWGVALSSRQRFAEAIPHFERALEIDPHLEDAHNNLEIARRLSASPPKPGP